MNTQRELLERALEQMRLAGWHTQHENEALKVIKNIEAELAKPEQETPQQEPLSDDEIKTLCQDAERPRDILFFIDGFRECEKRITEGKK